jgi:hypothetical protein
MVRFRLPDASSKSGERRKRISVPGFYPGSIRGVKSDRLLVLTVSKTIRKPVLSMGYRKAEHVRKLHGFNALDGTAVAEWAASPRGVLKFRPHSVGIDRH